MSVIVRKWNLDHFLATATSIHGNNFDYSEIDPNNFNGYRRKFTIKCNICHYKFDTNIEHHIRRKQKCRKCNKTLKYTYEIFIERAKIKHGDKYDYSLVKPDEIKNMMSKVPIICKQCGFQWNSTIRNHVKGSNCTDCSGTTRWTLERFLSKAAIVHGNKYNYSQISPEHIRGADSKLSIICNTCNYNWKVLISNHIRRTSGCPRCAGGIRCTAETVKNRGLEIFGNKYDYSLVTDELVRNARSKIPVKCNKCQKIWNVKIDSHLNNRTECPHCKRSVGEEACIAVLQKHSFPFCPQVRLKSLGRKSFDILFEHRDRKYLIEFDGEQHFEPNEHFHDNMEAFKERQESDILKSRVCVEEGYYLIRIDYSQINHVETHIINAIEMMTQPGIYFSTSFLYHYISHYLTLPQYGPKSDSSLIEKSINVRE